MNRKSFWIVLDTVSWRIDTKVGLVLKFVGTMAAVEPVTVPRLVAFGSFERDAMVVPSIECKKICSFLAYCRNNLLD